MQQQTDSGAQQRGKKSALVAGLGAAFVAAGITFAMLSSGPAAPPSPSSPQATAPAQTAMQVQAPPVQIAPPVQAAPPQTAPPVQTAAVPLAPQARSCPRRPLVEIAHVEHGGSGVVRFREGDYVSPWITLSDEDQPIVFPAPRRDTVFRDSIVIEGRATGLVLGADGDRFEVPNFDGSYNYTMDWHAAQKCE